tara:strand:+ start:2398 stop:2508 length:111 start_codon:yes stop_codon:yes gene_type:complete
MHFLPFDVVATLFLGIVKIQISVGDKLDDCTFFQLG